MVAVQSLAELDELLASAGSGTMIVLRVPPMPSGSAASGDAIVKASANSFRRLATARASSSSTVRFAEVSLADASEYADLSARLGVAPIPAGVGMFLCLRDGAELRRFAAIAAVDPARMCQIVDAAAAIGGAAGASSDDDAQGSCASGS